MKSVFSFLAVFALLLGLAGAPQAALAFTTSDTHGALQGGGQGAGFADPDEQQPALLAGPSDQSLNVHVQAGAPAPVTIDHDAAVEQRYGLSQAFDRAYSNK